MVAPTWMFFLLAYQTTLHEDKCQTRHNVVPPPTPNREQNMPQYTKNGKCVLRTWNNNGHAGITWC